MLRQLIPLVVLTLLNFFFVETRFSWTNCSPAGSPVTVTHLEITPDPIEVPGQLSFTLQGSTSEALPSSSISLDLTRIDEDGDEQSIPCILHIGSCTYDDSCTILDTFIKENYAGITADIGQQLKTKLAASGMDASQCPQPAQVLDLQVTVDLPEIPTILSILNFVDGDYRARLEITENISHRKLLCIDANLSIKGDCHGLACLLGKK